jgi:hypothetical protein
MFSEVSFTVGIGGLGPVLVGLGRCKLESYSITVGNSDILLLFFQNNVQIFAYYYYSSC